MILTPAAGQLPILLLLCSQRLAPSSLFGPPMRCRCRHRGVVVIVGAVDAGTVRCGHRHRHGRQCGPISGCEAMAEDVQLVLQH